jgi:hypothetical protein
MKLSLPTQQGSLGCVLDRARTPNHARGALYRKPHLQGDAKSQVTTAICTRNGLAALYVRVSTDQQTIAHQLESLRAVEERRGWQIVETYSDAGISGAKGRDKRPGLDAMLKDARRRRFDVVMA